jgi:hypothetical protein
MMQASGMFLDTNVAGAEHDSCAHNDLPPIFAGSVEASGEDFSFDAVIR